MGNSIYYMHLYANYMGIVTYGEEIGPGVFPAKFTLLYISRTGGGGILVVNHICGIYCEYCF